VQQQEHSCSHGARLGRSHEHRLALVVAARADGIVPLAEQDLLQRADIVLPRRAPPK
jgi:hypothetical protein